MISLEQDIQQSMERAMIFAAFLNSLSGDAAIAARSGAPTGLSRYASQAKPPAAIAKGANNG